MPRSFRVVDLMVSASLVSFAAACSAPKGSSKAAADSTGHATMTAAQHAGMHTDSTTLASSDTSFAQMQGRGQMAMGVDQYTSSHVFDITADGGRIELQRATYDSLEVAQIRAHMRLIQHAFAAGDFTTPAFVHRRDMPGTAVMTQKRSGIEYSYAELPRGAEVRIRTSDPEARAAIAEFLKAQRAEHRAAGRDAQSR